MALSGPRGRGYNRLHTIGPILVVSMIILVIIIVVIIIIVDCIIIIIIIIIANVIAATVIVSLPTKFSPVPQDSSNALLNGVYYTCTQLGRIAVYFFVCLFEGRGGRRLCPLNFFFPCKFIDRNIPSSAQPTAHDMYRYTKDRRS